MVSPVMVSPGGVLSWSTSLDYYRVQESAVLDPLPGMTPCQLPKVTQYGEGAHSGSLFRHST